MLSQIIEFGLKTNSFLKIYVGALFVALTVLILVRVFMLYFGAALGIIPLPPLLFYSLKFIFVILNDYLLEKIRV